MNNLFIILSSILTSDPRVRFATDVQCQCTARLARRCFSLDHYSAATASASISASSSTFVGSVGNCKAKVRPSPLGRSHLTVSSSSEQQQPSAAAISSQQSAVSRQQSAVSSSL